jgi:hypothetical protein
MGIAYQFAVGLSIVLFLYYGLRCLFSDAMADEFERFGIPRFRKLTGSLEVLGALGLLVGQVVSPLVVVASGGLALLMALGVMIRVRVRDSLVDMLPAIVLMLLNLYILVHTLW